MLVREGWIAEAMERCIVKRLPNKTSAA